MLKGVYFVTGTDTEIGKTYVSCQLLNAAQQAGLSSLGLKPLASGAVDGKNQDALLLQQASSIKLAYDKVNPFCFKSAVAPHLAAREETVNLTAKEIVSVVKPLFKVAELTLIEGAGGWLVPLNSRETWLDVVDLLNIPVIIVVGIRLGCINHALLTINAMENSGVLIKGWIANCIEPELPYLSENIKTLEDRIKAPLLTKIKFNKDSHQNA